jgi:hypothetical protein
VAAVRSWPAHLPKRPAAGHRSGIRRSRLMRWPGRPVEVQIPDVARVGPGGNGSPFAAGDQIHRGLTRACCGPGQSVVTYFSDSLPWIIGPICTLLAELIFTKVLNDLVVRCGVTGCICKT